jgi:hypothetical protein
VFAGAAACYTNANTPQQQTTPPPPPPPPDGEQFAQPPPGDPDEVADQAAPTAGSIEGSITEGGQPLVGTMVELRGDDGSRAQTRTDASGTYVFPKLRPGNYVVTTMIAHNPRSGPAQRGVTVQAGVVARADFQAQPYVPDRGPCCKPYGAPPARRRVV